MKHGKLERSDFENLFDCLKISKIDEMRGRFSKRDYTYDQFEKEFGIILTEKLKSYPWYWVHNKSEWIGEVFGRAGYILELDKENEKIRLDCGRTDGIDFSACKMEAIFDTVLGPSVHNRYSVDEALVMDVFHKRFPLNDIPEIVAMKMGLVDVTNSTHLSQQIGKCGIYKIAEIISNCVGIPDRLNAGDPTLVDELVNLIDNVTDKKLYSFVSKYAAYSNPFAYSKVDNVVADVLSACFDEEFSGLKRPTQWNGTDYNYASYNKQISEFIDKLGITDYNNPSGKIIAPKRKLFDIYIWYNNR